MTLATQENRKNYSATGDPDTLYSIPFWYNSDETWIEVYVDDVLEPVSSYVVDTINDTVKFNAGNEPESGKTITLFRSVPLDQEADYTAFGKFPAESHEAALDKLTAIAQQMLDSVKRSLKVAVSLSTGLDIELPAPAAKNAIRWNDAEDSFENFDPASVADLVLGDNEIAYKIPGGKITGLVLGEHQFVGRLPGGNIKALTQEEVRRALGDPEHATDSGTDAFVSATNTTPPGDGVKITRDFRTANSGSTPTLDGKTMTTRDGSALWAGAVSGPHELQYASGTDTYLVLEPSMEGGWRHRIEHVVDHGAAVDGTTNDTTELQAALDAAANGDGHVYMPRGTHLLGAITVPLDVVLELSPYAVIKPTSAFSGDLITLKNNARIEGGLIDCTGQSFTGDIIVPDPTPNVSGNTKRLVRGARNIAMKGDTTGRVLVLEALQDGESVYKDHYENVKCEGFNTFIRTAADNPGGGQRGYVNSNIFTACWCNNTVNGLTQDSNSSAGDITANEFVNCGVQHGSDTSKGLIIGGKYQSFINQQIWDFPVTGKNKLEFDSQSVGNYVEGFLGDGEITDGGTDNTAVNYSTGWMPAQVRKTSFTWDPGSISGGDVAVHTVGLGMGSLTSNFVVVQPRSDFHDLLALTWRMEAAVAGQLLVQLANSRSSASAIDPGNTTFDVYVFSFGTSDV